ncbi:hypothetical protein HYV57_02195 [Candidatus Peregrinibacteria bacterium]|nr:hypothetical protein [Candidatus Peregrinibacteria bacterium]
MSPENKTFQEKNESKIWKIVLIVGVILALAGIIWRLSGFFIAKNGTPEENNLTGDKTLEELTQSQIFENDKQALTEATQNGKPEKCDGIQNEILQRSCSDSAMMVKAKMTLNSELCQQVISEPARVRCLEIVQEAKADAP